MGNEATEGRTDIGSNVTCPSFFLGFPFFVCVRLMADVVSLFSTAGCNFPGWVSRLAHGQA